MPKRDIVLYNATSSGFETNLNSDIVRIKGSSTELLSIQNSSGTKNLQIDTTNKNLTFNVPLTASGDFSGSLQSTASFGRVVANKFAGDGSAMTNVPISSGTVSSSQQLATQISGAFDAGFTHSGAVSGSVTSTGSFGFATSAEYNSNINISGVTGHIPTNTISSSAQIAADISGSFQNGFNLTGSTASISGSSTSTGSFSRFFAGTIIEGDGRFLTNISYTPSTFSGSSQIASEISGSHTSGFTYSGEIKGVSLGAWTEVSELNQLRDYAMSAGGNGGTVDTKNSALMFGGRFPSPAASALTEEWNGTAWSEVGDLNTARYQGGGFGSTEAAVAVGGDVPPAAHSTCTEIYDGSEWNTGEAFPTPAASYMTTAGTQAAGLVMNGGYSPGTAGGGNRGQGSTENVNYSGGDWSAGENLISEMVRSAGGGTQNSAIIFGGLVNSQTAGAACTEVFPGAAWEVASAMIHKRAEFAGDAANENDALTAGNSYPSPGGTPGYGGTKTETWDGTAWSEKVDLPLMYMSNNMQGKSSGGLLFNGYWRNPGQAATPSVLQWDGTTASGMTNTGSFGRVEVVTKFGSGIDATNITGVIPAGAISGSAQIATDISGSFTSGFTFGNRLSTNQRFTASYVGVSGSAFAYAANATTMSISSVCGSDFDYRLDDALTGGRIRGKTIGTGAWSAGPNKITVESGMSGVGTQNAYLSAGGYKNPTPASALTEKYNGSAWAASATLIQANSAMAGFGTQNAAAFVGGHGDYDGTELYNGAAYVNAGNMGTQRRFGGSAGTQNAGLVFAGTGPSPSPNTDHAHTETFDGNAWTEVNNLNTGRAHVASAGTQNSAIAAAGFLHGGSLQSITELWNGTNWTETADMNTARNGAAGIGTQNHFLVAGGSTPSFSALTEEWNGTSWSEVNDLINARGSFSGGQGGLGTAGIIAGGQSTSAPNYLGSNCTEFWDDNSATGSFGTIDVKNFGTIGSLSGITNIIPANTVSGSAQIATDVSGSFTSGFNFTGKISGSSTSTGSFGAIFSNNWSITDSSGITGATGALTAGTISSSAQLELRNDVSGSFQKGFQFTGAISGSSTTTGSFGRVFASDYSILNTTLIKPTFLNVSASNGLISGLTGVIPDNTLSSSAQIASAISGSFNKGFNYVGNLSGSKTTTGSFNLIHALEYPNIDASAFLNPPTASGTVTGSSQLAADISGSFNEGFEFTGLISGSSTSTASFNNFISDKLVTKNFLNNNGINVIPHVGNSFFDTRQFLPGSASLQLTSCGSCSDTSTNGYDAFDGQVSVGTNGILNISFQTSSFAATNTRGIQAGAWSAGPNMLLARAANMVGSSNSSIAIGGTQAAGSAAGCPETQHFDGISWRQGGSITHYKYAGRPGSGATAGESENDAASYGFYTSAGHGADANNMYNGVVWTEGPKNPGGSSNGQGGAGCSAFSTVVFGGGTGTDEFNGTAWSEAANLNQTRNNTFGFGSQNAAVAHSGAYNNGRYHTEHYDGTSWTAVNSSLLAHDNGDGGAYGTQNSAHSNKQGTDHQSYDGVTWSRTTDSSVTRFYAGISGNAQNAMMIGGRSPSVSDTSVNTVEVFHNAFMSGSFLITKKIASNYS